MYIKDGLIWYQADAFSQSHLSKEESRKFYEELKKYFESESIRSEEENEYTKSF